jgi:hypothetical protein
MRNSTAPLGCLTLELLKRSSVNQQDLDLANFLGRRSSMVILIRACQFRSRRLKLQGQNNRDQCRNNRSVRSANKKADRRNDRDRLALREFQFPE